MDFYVFAFSIGLFIGLFHPLSALCVVFRVSSSTTKLGDN